jgi:hypothetical protein
MRVGSPTHNGRERKGDSPEYRYGPCAEYEAEAEDVNGKVD